MRPEEIVSRLSDRVPKGITEHDQRQLDVFESE